MTDVEYGRAIPMEPADAFEAISNSRRRRTILSLAREPDEIAASDLAEEIAAIENGVDPSHVTGKQRARVYVCLTQTHLQTLDEYGVVDYDERAKTLAATDTTQPLARYIRELQTSCYEPTEESG